MSTIASEGAAGTAISHSRRGPILVAIGSSGGNTAITAVRAIAARDASDIVVVSVVEPPPVYAVETQRAVLMPWLMEEQISARRRSVHERIHRLVADGTHDEPRIEVRYGDPGVEIARFARERGAHLIVMGIGQHAVRHRLLAASTAAATCRLAPCPVLAVSEHARPVARVAVIATDFSPESVYAAQMALPLLADRAVVHLVHAWTRVDAMLPHGRIAALNDAYAASLSGRFATLVSALRHGQMLAVETHAVNAKPADAVATVARATNADLVVAAPHRSSRLERWFLGSTSAALLRGAECSVLLVPEPAIAVRLQLERHMTGSSSIDSRPHWNEELQAFVRRNKSRRTKLQIDHPSFGAQIQESGYALVGAAYDAHDDRIALMFGGMHREEPHLTHAVGAVRSVTMRSDAHDNDRALCIEGDDGSALLTFLDSPIVVASANA